MLSLIEAPADLLSLAEARRQVRRPATFTDDDADLQRYLRAATGKVERETGRQLMPATYELWRPCFGTVRLPRPPLLEVLSITYVDTAGGVQTLSPATYHVVAPAGPAAAHGRVALAYGATWPSLRDQADAVRIRFRAGYADAERVPAELRQAVALLVGHWYQNREAVITGTIATEVDLAYRSLVADYVAYSVQELA